MKIRFNDLSHVPVNIFGEEEIERLNDKFLFSLIQKYTNQFGTFYFGILATGSPVMFVSITNESNSTDFEPFKEFFGTFFDEINERANNYAVFSSNKIFVKYENNSYFFDNCDTDKFFYKSIPVFNVNVTDDNFLNTASDAFIDLKDAEYAMQYNEYSENIESIEKLLEIIKNKKTQFEKMIEDLTETKNQCVVSSDRHGLLQEKIMLYPLNNDIENLLLFSFVENARLKCELEKLMKK